MNTEEEFAGIDAEAQVQLSTHRLHVKEVTQLKRDRGRLQGELDAIEAAIKYHESVIREVEDAYHTRWMARHGCEPSGAKKPAERKKRGPYRKGS